MRLFVAINFNYEARVLVGFKPGEWEAVRSEYGNP